MAEKQRGASWKTSAILTVSSVSIMGLMMWHYIPAIVAATLWGLLMVGHGAYLWSGMGPLNPRRDESENGSV
jgi:hypothetical protein